MKVGLKIQNITYIIDKLLRNHIHKIIVIHWISYEPFEQPGPDSCPSQGTVNGGAISKWPRCRWDVKHNQPNQLKIDLENFLSLGM